MSTGPRGTGVGAEPGCQDARRPRRLRGGLVAWCGLCPAEIVQQLLRGPGQGALAVCAAFNTTNRLADASGFEVLSPEGFLAGAKYLRKRGHR